MAITIESPRAQVDHPRRRFNIEKWGWIYMRASGVVLVVLIFGHLFVNLYAGEGVRQIDFAFIAGKYASPFWQVWDILLLWLALVHGANGMRTVTNDYVVAPAANRILKVGLIAATLVLLVLGTLVVFTFDPCPANATAGSLPTFCAAK